jgi:hypothetical protein
MVVGSHQRDGEEEKEQFPLFRGCATTSQTTSRLGLAHHPSIEIRHFHSALQVVVVSVSSTD